MTTILQTRESEPSHASRRDPEKRPWSRSTDVPLRMEIRRALLLLSIAKVLATLSVMAKSQSLSYSESSPVTAATSVSGQAVLVYVRPTARTKLNNYIFDAYGPYPIAGAAVAAGISQWSNAPPEWNQGAEGFTKRFGSDFAIAAIGTTARYGLAEAFKEDTLYYRCECSGVWPRTSHAVTSALMARRGEDGHRVFSFSALVAPYAGTMTAVYGWYPNRYGAKDAFRMGNYGLLAYVGENLALEFFHSSPHSLLARMHLKSTHGSPSQEPGQ